MSPTKWDAPTDPELLRALAHGIERYVLLGIDIPRAARLLRELADGRQRCAECGGSIVAAPAVCARCEPDRSGG